MINKDYFTYYREHDAYYDAIVGNPPFIRSQSFNEEFRQIAFELMQKHGFHPNRLTNIWLPFLLLSCKKLTDNGRIGMVIPAELFQVDYAAEARSFLSEFFDSLVLITFKQLVFDDIQQEVILLLGEKSSKQKGIRVIELDNIDDLAQGTAGLDHAEVKTLDHNSEKWVKYYLSNEELHLLKKLANDQRLTPTTSLFDVNVGLVSGENDFFVINRDTVDRYNLHNHVMPIVSKAEQVKGLTFTETNLDEVVKNNGELFYLLRKTSRLKSYPKKNRNISNLAKRKGFIITTNVA